MLLTLSLGKAIGARRAGGGRRPRAELAERERPQPRLTAARASSCLPRPAPASTNASLCCLMRDPQPRDTCMYGLAGDRLPCPGFLFLLTEKRKRVQL